MEEMPHGLQRVIDLAKSVEGGDAEVVRLRKLVMELAEADSAAVSRGVDEYGMTALMWACCMGSVDKVMVLLDEGGADPSVTNNKRHGKGKDRTALSLAMASPAWRELATLLWHHPRLPRTYTDCFTGRCACDPTPVGGRTPVRLRGNGRAMPEAHFKALVHHPLVLAVQKVDLNRVAFLVQDLGVSLALRIPPPPTRQQAAAGPPAHEYRSVLFYATVVCSPPLVTYLIHNGAAFDDRDWPKAASADTTLQKRVNSRQGLDMLVALMEACSATATLRTLPEGFWNALLVLAVLNEQTTKVLVDGYISAYGGWANHAKDGEGGGGGGGGAGAAHTYSYPNSGLCPLTRRLDLRAVVNSFLSTHEATGGDDDPLPSPTGTGIPYLVYWGLPLDLQLNNFRLGMHGHALLPWAESFAEEVLVELHRLAHCYDRWSRVGPLLTALSGSGLCGPRAVQTPTDAHGPMALYLMSPFVMRAVAAFL